MGHASPETTARYDKRAKSSLLEKRRRMRLISIVEEDGAGDIQDPDKLLALFPAEPKQPRPKKKTDVKKWFT
jgi:hypothetical protein